MNNNSWGKQLSKLWQLGKSRAVMIDDDDELADEGGQYGLLIYRTSIYY